MNGYVPIFTYCLTWTISPITNTMAMHDTISAWFWIKNSWLNMGGFLLEDFLPFNAILCTSPRILDYYEITSLYPTTQRINTQPKPDYCSDTRLIPNTNQQINSSPPNSRLITYNCHYTRKYCLRTNVLAPRWQRCCKWIMKTV